MAIDKQKNHHSPAITHSNHHSSCPTVVADKKSIPTEGMSFCLCVFFVYECTTPPPPPPPRTHSLVDCFHPRTQHTQVTLERYQSSMDWYGMFQGFEDDYLLIGRVMGAVRCVRIHPPTLTSKKKKKRGYSRFCLFCSFLFFEKWRKGW